MDIKTASGAHATEPGGGAQPGERSAPQQAVVDMTAFELRSERRGCRSRLSSPKMLCYTASLTAEEW
jgi:hypothetical protein